MLCPPPRRALLPRASEISWKVSDGEVWPVLRRNAETVQALLIARFDVTVEEQSIRAAEMACVDIEYCRGYLKRVVIAGCPTPLRLARGIRDNQIIHRIRYAIHLQEEFVCADKGAVNTVRVPIAAHAINTLPVLKLIWLVCRTDKNVLCREVHSVE